LHTVKAEKETLKMRIIWLTRLAVCSTILKSEQRKGDTIMDSLNYVTFLEKVSQLMAMVSLLIQTAFMGYTAAACGVRVMVQNHYIDTETGEIFARWQGLRGFRLFLISQLVD
jgi:hypothetical protein